MMLPPPMLVSDVIGFSEFLSMFTLAILTPTEAALGALANLLAFTFCIWMRLDYLLFMP